MTRPWNGSGLPVHWARLRLVTPLQRWAAKVVLPVEPSGCWEWIGAKSENGYAKLHLLGKTVRAHRYSFGVFVGPIPEGLQLDHLCRNRGCVNPSHLRAVTQRVNVLVGQGIMAGFAKQTHCTRGHPFDERNTRMAKIGNGRYCRVCARERERIRRLKVRAANALNALDEERAS